MQLLALETSTTLGSCALWRDGQCIERFCPAGQSHSETLLPLIRALLAEAGVALTQLDAIAFGAGPGAFTGLRVACGVAQGLAVGASLPVVPVGTLDTLAWASGAVCCLAMLDARMGEVYSGLFVREMSGVRALGDLCLCVPQKMAWPQEKCVAVGNALSAYPLLAEEAVTHGIRIQPELMPHAADVAALAALKLAAGEVCDPALAVPLYVRDKVARTIVERLSEGGKA
ncbi:MAG: tsaB [Proteobacteria bacterium]|nr:tsaB [Pseudomonadota bacterium]